VLDPEVEGVGLKEWGSKGIKEVVRSESLESGIVSGVLVRHDSSWCNFTLSFWEEETFNSEFKVLGVDLWGRWDRPVEVHMIINVAISFLRSNELVDSWWNSISQSVINLTSNLISDSSHEQSFEKASKFSDNVTMNM
jgi:hypothetical protein